MQRIALKRGSKLKSSNAKLNRPSETRHKQSFGETIEIAAANTSVPANLLYDTLIIIKSSMYFIHYRRQV